jgi:hypothetical protein
LIVNVNKPGQPSFEVHVYKEGITRICAEPYSSTNDFGQLTNTAVNKRSCQPADELTKSMSATLAELYQESQRVAVWEKIKRSIMLSVIAALPYLLVRPEKVTESVWNECRCFQILGFDVMIVENDQPYILEVTYRPSLSRDTEFEKELKQDMVADALQIVVQQMRDAMPGRTKAEEYAKAWEEWRKWKPAVHKSRAQCHVFEKVNMDRGLEEVMRKSLRLGCSWERRDARYGDSMPAMTEWDEDEAPR